MGAGAGDGVESGDIHAVGEVGLASGAGGKISEKRLE